MESWLIRTSQNQILRPCSREELCRLIVNGDLKLQDEVCSGASYWFYLHESEELKQQLGLEMPRARSSDIGDDITETSTQPDLDRTDPQIRTPLDGETEKARESNQTQGALKDLPSMDAWAAGPRVETRGVGIEPQPVLWAVVIILTLGGGGGILYWVTRLIQN